MFTVMVCLDWSGNNNTRRPLAKRYSVIPSTEVNLAGEGEAVAGAGATVSFVGFGFSFPFF